MKTSTFRKDAPQLFKDVEKVLEQYRLIKWTSYLGQLEEGEPLPDEISPQLKGQIRFCEKVEKAIKQLPPRERELIKLRYLDNESEYISDGELYGKLNPPVSRPTYIKIRDKAMMKLAFTLDVGRITDTHSGSWKKEGEAL